MSKRETAEKPFRFVENSNGENILTDRKVQADFDDSSRPFCEKK